MASFFFSYLICLILTPILSEFFIKLKIVDKPDKSNLGKIHKNVTSLSGGLTIVISCSVVFFCNALFFGFSNLDILLLSVFMMTVGLLDDLFDLYYKPKLILQCFTTCLFLYANSIEIPFVHPFLNLPLQFIWIVGITNAVNLMDNIDGAAGGVMIISFLTLLYFSTGFVTIYLAILIGALFGFVFWNWHPAITFLGDSGTLFLGFIAATLSLLTIESFVVSPIDLILLPMIFSFPILDTTVATFIRLYKRRPIYLSDGSNITFLLKERNWKYLDIVFFQYSISFLCCSAVLLYKIYI